MLMSEKLIQLQKFHQEIIDLNLFTVKKIVLSEITTRKYDLAQLFCFHVCLVWLVLGDDFHNLEMVFNASF